MPRVPARCFVGAESGSRPSTRDGRCSSLCIRNARAGRIVTADARGWVEQRSCGARGGANGKRRFHPLERSGAVHICPVDRRRMNRRWSDNSPLLSTKTGEPVRDRPSPVHCVVLPPHQVPLPTETGATRGRRIRCAPAGSVPQRRSDYGRVHHRRPSDPSASLPPTRRSTECAAGIRVEPR